MNTAPDWLTVTRGDAPLVVSIPHTGIDLAGLDDKLVSPWLARRDTDWWIEKLYDFADGLGATAVRTSISRTVIDVNRDPSGVSLYPGQATTGLCPTETFDGEPLYREGQEPDEAEIARRRETFFEPYHDALTAELVRLRQAHEKIVLYDCHSIRSVIPRLFQGELPVFNLGTNGGTSVDPVLERTVSGVIAGSGESFVVNGRFRGGWITRHYGRPEEGVHALQMELACRGYLHEPVGPVDESNWPVDYDPEFAAPLRAVLHRIFDTALEWARR
jgi:N-formylglutamate deformylase